MPFSGSRPSWARGLKLRSAKPDSARNGVAPFVGAWIETSSGRLVWVPVIVAPFVGAWIETMAASVPFSDLRKSRPSWARGLKLFYAVKRYENRLCRALRGRVD